MKKKVSIITLNGYSNYGNRLQLFALSDVVSSLGCDVSVVWPQKVSKMIKGLIKRSPIFRSFFKKEYKLWHFTKKYVVNNDDKNEEYVIVGSDQVWNPEYIAKNSYLVPKDKKNKISYAASMGVDDLQLDQKRFFSNLISDFIAISVREQSAKKILQPLTNKEIEVVLDPTLLISKRQYESIEEKPEKLPDNEKYILCYILGNRDHEEKIEKFAKEKGYKTIYFSDKRDSNYGVEEFLYLIHHAELICTDSFHACVFSFIFERPFVAFRRTGEANYMYTRLQNLIDTFKLKNREFNGKEITKENLEVDYTEAKKILKKEQKKSLDFLKRALDIKDEN